MTMELIAISGLGVTLIGIAVTLGGLILHGQNNLREEMQGEFRTQREAMNTLQGRVAYVEGLLEGLREAITGQRVAEHPGNYEPR